MADLQLAVASRSGELADDVAVEVADQRELDLEQLQLNSDARIRE